MQGTTAAKRREGKNAAGPISSISGKGEVIITEKIKNKFFFRKILTKAENEEECSISYCHLLRGCQGLRCIRIDAHALVLQLTDRTILLYFQIKGQKFAFILKVIMLLLSQFDNSYRHFNRTMSTANMPLLPWHFWMRWFCVLKWYTCFQTPKMKKEPLL